MAELLIMGIEAGTAGVETVLCDLDGAVRGRGWSGSANPSAIPVGDVATHLAEAVGVALAGIDPLDVRAVVLGTAGILKFRFGESARRLSTLWSQAGLACPVTVVEDAVTAFAAGAPESSGSVLIAGAGAIAARVEYEQVTARVDGNGWLVGDDGSGFWLGRQAVRAVFAALDGRGEDTLLRDAVLETALPPGEPARESSAEERIALLRDAVYDGPPIALAALAPLVPAAAAAGDRVAHRILERAVDLLVETADPLIGELRGTQPLVLAGSLLTADGPMRRAVSHRLTEMHGRAPRIARPGAGGALWLAARRIDRGFGPADHEQFTALGAPPRNR